MQLIARALRLPSSARADRCLAIDARAVEEDARRCGPPDGIATIVLRHAWTRWKLWRRGISLGVRGPEALHAYSAMSVPEFDAINGRQMWANWRTVPRSLAGRIPASPVVAIDLCCGDGASTAVLAWWLPTGSVILGYEADERLARAGDSRVFRARDGSRAAVRIFARSVMEPFRDADDRLLEDGSVDVVNACGAFGCHFAPAQTALVMNEVARVLAPGGHAFIDAGSAGTSARELAMLAGGRGLSVVGRARSCLFDRHPQIALRKAG